MGPFQGQGADVSLADSSHDSRSPTQREIDVMPSDAASKCILMQMVHVLEATTLSIRQLTMNASRGPAAQPSLNAESNVKPAATAAVDGVKQQKWCQACNDPSVCSMGEYLSHLPGVRNRRLQNFVGTSLQSRVYGCILCQNCFSDGMRL